MEYPAGDIRQLGRVGLKTILYTLVIAAISVIIGLTLVNLIQPGTRIDQDTAAGIQAQYGITANEEVGAAEASLAKKEEEAIPVLTLIIGSLIPENPLLSMAGERPIFYTSCSLH